MVDGPNYKKHLAPEQYKICWNRGTELPFSSQYHDCKKDKGIDKCVCCGNSPFTSDTKFNSGTGWSSFWTPINEGSVKEEMDKSYGMVRTGIWVPRVVHIWGMYLTMEQSQPACAAVSILCLFY